MHREIRLSLNIFNSHCLVSGVICTHLWCLGCCVSCRSRCADMWGECWRRRAAGGRIRFQDQTWQKFSQEPFQRLLYPTEINCRFYCEITVLLKNKISCGILLSLEQRERKILKHKMPLKKDVRQHSCMWRVQIPAGVCLDHSSVNNIPTDVRTPQITKGKLLYIHFSCKRCDAESINWLLSPFYEIAQQLWP